MTGLQTFTSGRLMLVQRFPERRGSNGLIEGPQLFVVGYDEEQDYVFGERVSWKAAFALAPRDMNALANMLKAFRDNERAATQETPE